MARFGPSNPPQVTVLIEYDTKAGRGSKTFTDIYAGRRFFTAKDKAGKNPKIFVRKEG